MPAHLQISRHNIFYFRRVVPEDVRATLGRREIKVSLKTSDRREASRLAKLLDFHIETIFLEARRSMSKKSNVSPLELIVKGGVRNSDGTFTFESLEMDPNCPDGEKKLLEALSSTLRGASSNPTTTTTPSQPNAPKLSELIGAFCQDRLRGGSWTEKSHQEAKAIYDLLIKIITDMPCSNFSHQYSREVKDTLLKLPPHLNKSPQYRDRSITSILADKPEKTMSVTTINKYLSRYSELFRWGKRHGYVPENYFEGLTIKNKVAASAQREAFSREDLARLFGSQIHTHNNFKHPYQYWLPLLGLYSGARINELCQLHLNDIIQKDGIWVLDINDDSDDKRLKNPSSRRIIPIHSRLLDLGILDYVKKLSRKGEERLFPELALGRDGYSKNATRWFNDRFKHQQGVHNQKKVFHSFRHTLASAMKRAGIDEGHAKAILGHAEESVTYGRYGKEHSLETLQDALERAELGNATKNVLPYQS